MSTATVADPARASYLRSNYDAERHMFRHTLSYVGTGKIHEVSGYADGSGCHCTCDGYKYSRRNPAQCRHTVGFTLMLEHVEYTRQAGRETPELLTQQRDLEQLDLQGPDARRLLNAIRAVLRARGVRSHDAVRRGKSAADELFGGAA